MVYCSQIRADDLSSSTGCFLLVSWNRVCVMNDEQALHVYLQINAKLQDSQDQRMDYEISEYKSDISCYTDSMIKRLKYLELLKTAVRRSLITAVLGPRQTGKTTLAHMFAENKPATFFDLESLPDQRLHIPVKSHTESGLCRTL